MAISIEHTFKASADQVWAIVGVPDRVDWVPGIEGCDFDGRVRRFSMQGAGNLAEEIVSLDNDAKRIVYRVVESEPMLEYHLASIALEELQEGAKMTWQTEVEPVAAEKFIEVRMRQCLERIGEILSCDHG